MDELRVSSKNSSVISWERGRLARKQAVRLPQRLKFKQYLDVDLA